MLASVYVCACAGHQRFKAGFTLYDFGLRFFWSLASFSFQDKPWSKLPLEMIFCLLIIVQCAIIVLCALCLWQSTLPRTFHFHFLVLDKNRFVFTDSANSNWEQYANCIHQRQNEYFRSDVSFCTNQSYVTKVLKGSPDPELIKCSSSSLCLYQKSKCATESVCDASKHLKYLRVVQEYIYTFKRISSVCTNF